MDELEQIKINRLLLEFLRDENLSADDFLSRQDGSDTKAKDACTILTSIVDHASSPAPSNERSELVFKSINNLKRKQNLEFLKAKAKEIKFVDIDQFGQYLTGSHFVLNRKNDNYTNRQSDNFKILDLQSIEAVSNTINEFDLQSPVDLYELADNLGIFVGRVPMPDRDGCIFMNNDLKTIFLNQDIKNIRRERFTFAHEIGHSILHSNIGTTFYDNNKSFRDFNSHYERQANVFASHILAPDSSLKKIINTPPSIECARMVSSLFDLSLSASLVRLISFSDWDCALVVSFENSIKWYYCGEFFPHRIQINSFLDSRSQAYGISKNQISSAVSPEFSWISNTEILHEESYMTESGWTYSILRTITE